VKKTDSSRAGWGCRRRILKLPRGCIIATYRKYAYWANQGDAQRLKNDLTAQGFEVVEPRKAVCIPLSRRSEIGIVPPDTWKNTDLCKRPLSWYWTSPFAGNYLIISSKPLERFGFIRPIILKSVTFRPPRLPDTAGQIRLASHPSYLKAKPVEWDDLDAEDPARQDRWLKVMGIRGKTYRELFLTHCANHANFIAPEYFVQDGEAVVPYSIAKTREVCSACLEFFNIIGRKYKKKLVVPCPGAVIFAGLPVNTYIEVDASAQTSTAPCTAGRCSVI